MRMNIPGLTLLMLSLAASPLLAQSVKHIQPSTPGGIATGGVGGRHLAT